MNILEKIKILEQTNCSNCDLDCEENCKIILELAKLEVALIEQARKDFGSLTEEEVEYLFEVKDSEEDMQEEAKSKVWEEYKKAWEEKRQPSYTLPNPAPAMYIQLLFDENEEED